MPFAWAAGIGAVGSVAGGLISSSGAQDAADTTAAAQNYSAQLQDQHFQQALANEQPYINSGYTGVNALTSGLSDGTLGKPMDLSGMQGISDGISGTISSLNNASVPQYSWNAAAAGGMPSRSDVHQFSWDPTQQGLESTPGYQFTRDQGLAAVQRQAAAKGLGVGGATQAAAANYAEQLASTTYNQQLQNAINTNKQQNEGVSLGNTIYNNQVMNSVAQNQQQLSGYNAGLDTYSRQLQGYQAQGNQYQNTFNDYWANNNNRFNQLANLATLGANTSVSAGTQSVNSASNVGNALSAAGVTQGTGIQNSANALGGSLSTLGTNLTNNPYLNNYIQKYYGSGADGTQSYGNSAGTPSSGYYYTGTGAYGGS